MLNVFLTIDTELWPMTPMWRESGLAHELELYIYGHTPQGAFDLPFQMQLLNQYELKAVFFVEALFACTVGLDPLRQIVTLIQSYGHEVQLHVHTEWLSKLTSSFLPGRTGQHIKDFSESEQALIITQGAQNLKACGVDELCAFRAGNFGANFDTLHALAHNGILYDTRPVISIPSVIFTLLISCFSHNRCAGSMNTLFLSSTIG